MTNSILCTGRTKAGSPCQKKAAIGSQFCPQHTPGRSQKRGPRKSHFGAVRKLPSGRYQATYWRDGERHSQTFGVNTPKRDVQEWLAAIETDMKRGQLPNPKAGAVSFREYAERWLASGVVTGRIRRSTEAKYQGLLDRHLLPEFGTTPLSKIRADDVESWFLELKAKRPSTAAGAYRLLATIFNSASRIVPSPCLVDGASQEPETERPTATVVECQAAVDAVPTQYRCAVLLAAWGQLRRGEVLGLRRRVIDLSAGTVKVECEWLLLENGRTYLEEDTKSKAGKRTLYLPPHVQTALRTHLSTHVGPTSEAWLFPGPDGMPMHPRTFGRVWTRARKVAGRPDLHFHDLRGTGLTWLAQDGATMAELMHRAGHGSPTAAMRYQRAEAERDKALAERLGQRHATVRIITVGNGGAMADNTTIEVDGTNNQCARVTNVTGEGCLKVEVLKPVPPRSFVIPYVGQALPVTPEYIATELTRGVTIDFARELATAIIETFPDIPS